jgi:hypothetical protein
MPFGLSWMAIKGACFFLSVAPLKLGENGSSRGAGPYQTLSAQRNRPQCLGVAILRRRRTVNRPPFF